MSPRGLHFEIPGRLRTRDALVGAAVNEGESGRLIDQLCSLAGLDGFDTAAEEVELPHLLSTLRHLDEALGATTAHLQALEALQPEDDADIDSESEPPTVDGVSVVVQPLPRLADVCFAGRLELTRASQELGGAATLETALAAQETALRKLRRAIRAVVDAARESGLAHGSTGQQLRERGGADLASALAVRRLYAELRRGLRAPEAESPDAIPDRAALRGRGARSPDLVGRLRESARHRSRAPQAPASTPLRLGSRRQVARARARATRRHPHRCRPAPRDKSAPRAARSRRRAHPAAVLRAPAPTFCVGSSSYGPCSASTIS